MIRKYKLNNSCTTYVIYNKKNKSKPAFKKTIIGERVYNRYLGWGEVVSVLRDVCTIKYADTKMQCYKEDALRLIEKTKDLIKKNENSD